MATAPISAAQLYRASDNADDYDVVVNGSVSGAGSSTINQVGNTLYSLARLQQLYIDRINTGTSPNNRGEWQANTAYAVNDGVSYQGVFYVATAAFTSGATFQPDLTAGRWTVRQGATTASTPGFDPVGDGAVGNGTTDDTTAVTATIGRGKTIWINNPVKLSGAINLGRVAFGPSGRIVTVGGATVTLSVYGDPGDQRIFDTTAGGGIVLTQQWVRPDWWGDVQRNIMMAVAALPVVGGDVLLLNKRYPLQRTVYDTNYLSKPGIRLLGSRMPNFNADASALENGTVIEGRFNVFADNFEHYDLGYDLGLDVCDEYYPGIDTHTQPHPDGYTWDAFAFAVPGSTPGTALRRGYIARNVRALVRDPLSVGHGILQEGIEDADIQNVYGCGATHAFVIKSRFVRARNIGGYGSSENQIIIKSDSYAQARSVKLDAYDTGRYPADITGWWPAMPSRNGLHLQAAADNLTQIQFSNGFVRGARRAFYTSSGAGLTIADVQGMNNIFDSFGVSDGADYQGVVRRTTGMLFEAERHERFQLGNVIVNNVTDGIVATQPAVVAAEELSFGSIKATNVSGVTLKAIGFARIKAEEFHATNVGDVYYEEQNSRVLIGVERLVSFSGGKFTTASGSGFSTSGFNYLSGWSAGGSAPAAFALKKDNYGMLATGNLVVSGVSKKIATLAPFLRPLADMRTTLILYGAGNFAPAVLVVAPDGQFNVEGSGDLSSGNEQAFVGQTRWEVV